MAESTTKAVIRFKDWITMDDDVIKFTIFLLLILGGVFKKILQVGWVSPEDSIINRILQSIYVYKNNKFHTDITRIFMEPIATILNKYYDKKRKFEYYRIAKLIEEENKKNP